MSRNFNIKAATFDGTTINDPQQHRITESGEVVNHSAGTDRYITGQQITSRKVFVQVSFNDHDSAEALIAKQGTQATLTLVVSAEDDGTSATATVVNAMLIEVIELAQHADYGQHVATWEAISSDGTTSPLSWA